MKALLIVDIQNGLIKRKLYQKEKFLETVNFSIQTIRKSKGLIIFIQHNNNFLVNPGSDWQLCSELDIKKEDIIIQKKHGNAFEKTELLKTLTENFVDSVYICGLVTHGCVRASCIGSMELGFKTFLIKNGHSNWALDAKKKIELMENEMRRRGISFY
jgi:nicotinamidase-related amidase